MSKLALLKKKLAAAKNETVKEEPKKDKKPKKEKAVKTVKNTKETKKKPIGFNLAEADQKAIENGFESMQEKAAEFENSLSLYLEGKKRSAKDARASLMDIIKVCKDLRVIIQSSKENLEPIYKD